MKGYKYIIWDIDGTLLDTISINVNTLMRIVKEELGEDKSYEELAKYMSYPGKIALKVLGIENVDEVHKRWVKYVNEDEIGALPYEGIKYVLDKLLENGYIQAVTSSKTRAQYEIDMVRNNLHKYMKAKVLFEDIENSKPHPEPLIKTMKILKAKPEECLYIGDMKSDYLCAKASSVDFALALWGCLDKEGIEAQYELEKAIDLLNIVSF